MAGNSAVTGPVTLLSPATRSSCCRPGLGCGGDLPEVAVGVAEVPGVPAPLARCCLFHDAATCCHRVGDDLVSGLAGVDDVVERNPAEPGSLGRDARVLGRCVPLVQGQ